MSDKLEKLDKIDKNFSRKKGLSKNMATVQRKNLHQKLFIVRKYIFAGSVMEACNKEKKYPVDDCFMDDEWRRNQENSGGSGSIGFK